MDKTRYWMSGGRLVVEIANSPIWSLSIVRFAVMWGGLIGEKSNRGKGEV